LVGGDADCVRSLAVLPVEEERGVAVCAGFEDRDRREQLVAVGEVPVRGGGRDAEASARLGEGEIAHSSFRDQVDGGIDEGRPEVAMVVTAALAGLLRWGR